MDGPTFESFLTWTLPLIIIVIGCNYIISVIARQRHQ
jgi:cytochrome c-type biogenesis protein CcmH/NrfF